MRRIKIFTFLFLIAFAADVNAQKSYKSPAANVKIAGKTIVAKSEAYVNAMPMVADGVQNRDCSKTGTLIAPVTIETANNSKLPKGIEIKRVWIKSGNFRQEILSNKDETSVKENSIYSVARACPNSNIKPDQTVKIVIEIRHKGKSYFIATSQTKLEKVY